MARPGGSSFNAAEWLNALTRCKPYTTEALPGAVAMSGSYEAAEKSIINVRLAFEHIKSSNAEEIDFDRLAHATGVSKVRYVQIFGKSAPMLLELNLADSALIRCKARYQRWGKWEFIGDDVQHIADALDLYETVLVSSSPKQMTIATDLRLEILDRMKEPA